MRPGGTGSLPVEPSRPTVRADARRNRERILTAAEAVVARDGAEASLEEVARRAGVGSATLHRHFPTRHALLEAVFHDRVAELCARAEDLAAGGDPGSALVQWLRALGAYAVSTRGLAGSLIESGRDAAPVHSETCAAMLTGAGEVLVQRARQAGAVRPEVTTVDLLTLVTAISLATEQGPHGATDADRLLVLALEGIGPRTTA